MNKKFVYQVGNNKKIYYSAAGIHTYLCFDSKVCPSLVLKMQNNSAKAVYKKKICSTQSATVKILVQP
jgi:hypothetical protein